MERSVWIGFDPRETDGYAVTRSSVVHGSRVMPVRGLVLDDLRQRGLYTRETARDPEGRLFDVISGFPMATEFAISRFLVPHLVKLESKFRGPRWAVFMDSDMLVRHSINHLFELADPRYAVMVVKHNHNPTDGVKMDGQVQSAYERKNWSSVILWNVDHPALEVLTPELVNTWAGRDLHGFRFLKDEYIGTLPLYWNYLIGYNEPQDLWPWGGGEPSLVHFTNGIPSMKGYEDSPYAGEWRQELVSWAK